MAEYKVPNAFNIRLGERIRNLRESLGEKQDSFAQRLGINRSTLSLIENGTQQVSMELCAKLVQQYGLNIQDLFVADQKKHIVVDTNIIMNCPNILNKLNSFCDVAYIPQTVISELEYRKKSANPQIRKTAGQSLDMIIRLRSDQPDDTFVITDGNSEGNNDDRIFSVAKEIATKNPNESVYMLTNDKDFKLKAVKKLTNLRVINSTDFEQIFVKEDDYNQAASQRFFVAVLKKDIENAKKLAEKNVNVNYIDTRSGFTPLIQAIRNRDCTMVGFLLTLPQINVNAVDDKKYRLPPISHAIQISHHGLVTQMIKNGANVNEPSQSDRNPYNTPLMIAAWDGKFDIVQLLVENGACINQQDKGNGFTALIKAVWNNHTDIVRYLLEHNADSTICSFEKKTALDYAYEKNDDNRYREIIDLLKG